MFVYSQVLAYLQVIRFWNIYKLNMFTVSDQQSNGAFFRFENDMFQYLQIVYVDVYYNT